MIKRKVFYIPQRLYSEFKGNKYDYLFTRIEELKYCEAYQVMWLKFTIDKIIRFNKGCIVKVELEIKDRRVDVTKVVKL